MCSLKNTYFHSRAHAEQACEERREKSKRTRERDESQHVCQSCTNASLRCCYENQFINLLCFEASRACSFVFRLKNKSCATSPPLFPDSLYSGLPAHFLTVLHTPHKYSRVSIDQSLLNRYPRYPTQNC